MEREADRVGFGVLTDAGYSPAGMAAMFEKLENANRLNDSGAYPYLRSHPLTVQRISEARGRLALSGAAAPADPVEHVLMAARSRVLMDPGAEGLRRQQQRLAGAMVPGAAPLSFNDRLGALYGGALASLLLDDAKAADAAVAKALELLRDKPSAPASADRAFKELQVQVVLQRGDPAAALKLLDAPVLQPASRWTRLLRGQAALALWTLQAADAAACAQAAPAAAAAPASAPPAGPACQAYAALRGSNESLQDWVAAHPRDPLSWSMLAQGEEALGQRLRAMRAQAEARAAVGDLNGAVDRLRAAQTLARTGAANDFIEASVIDARLRQLEAQRREISAELRAK
jgi:predicted Zn-dependent protease